MWVELIIMLVWQKIICSGDLEPKIAGITTKSFNDPAPKTPTKEVICINAFQMDMVNQSQMLIGLCRNDVTNQSSSGAIGVVPVVDFLFPNRSISSVNELYGNTSTLAPANGTNWDGVGTEAMIVHPEEFAQERDALYFVDVKCCLRKVNQTTYEVTTLMGSCGNSTLNLPGVAPSRIYGMTYLMENKMFVFMVADEGVFACTTSPTNNITCRKVIEKSNFNTDISTDMGRQLIRGVNSDGSPNHYIWHKVSYGINRYNFSKVVESDSAMLSHANNGIEHYASIRESGEIEITSRYRERDYTLGDGDVVLLFSQDGKVLLIFDIDSDVLLILDADPDDGIDNIIQLCEKDPLYPRSNILLNCTFSDIRAAVWLKNNNTILVAENNPGEIRFAFSCPKMCNLRGTLVESCEGAPQICPCRPNIEGPHCSMCTNGTWNFPLCTSCSCSTSGSTDMTCDQDTGQCSCKSGYAGKQCTECADDFYGYPNCVPCDCNNDGSVNTTCEESTGACFCKMYYDGLQCDICTGSSYSFPLCDSRTSRELTFSHLLCDFELRGSCPITRVNITGYIDLWKQIFILPFDGLTSGDKPFLGRIGGTMFAEGKAMGEKGAFMLGPLDNRGTTTVDFLYRICSEGPTSTLNLSWVNVNEVNDVSIRNMNFLWTSNGAARPDWTSVQTSFISTNNFYLIWIVMRSGVSGYLGSDVEVDDVRVNPVKFEDGDHLGQRTLPSARCSFNHLTECQEFLTIFDWKQYNWLWEFQAKDSLGLSSLGITRDADGMGGFLYLNGKQNGTMGAVAIGPIHNPIKRYRLTFYYYCQNVATAGIKLFMVSNSQNKRHKRDNSAVVLWSADRSTNGWEDVNIVIEHSGPFEIIFMGAKMTAGKISDDIAIDGISIQAELAPTTHKTSTNDLQMTSDTNSGAFEIIFMGAKMFPNQISDDVAIDGVSIQAQLASTTHKTSTNDLQMTSDTNSGSPNSPILEDLGTTYQIDGPTMIFPFTASQATTQNSQKPRQSVALPNPTLASEDTDEKIANAATEKRGKLVPLFILLVFALMALMFGVLYLHITTSVNEQEDRKMAEKEEAEKYKEELFEQADSALNEMHVRRLSEANTFSVPAHGDFQSIATTPLVARP